MFIRLILVLFCITVALPAQAQPVVPGNKEEISLSFSPIVKKVAPAVVNIYTKRTVSRVVQNPLLNDPFFGQLFNQNMFGGRMRRQVESTLGSGVVIDPQGLAVTNAHVVKGASEITVVLNDGREFDATLALSDDASDLALLRFEPHGAEIPHVTLRPSETLEVGDLVLAIGNPFGVGQTVTSGIVSAQGSSALNINDFNFFIQTDAAINPGNSGGPLVALDGGVVGINSAIYSRDGGSLGIGFAIPSEMVASIVAAEKSGQTGDKGILRPWLGVEAQNLSSDIADSLGLDRPYGSLILNLHPASPLKQAGIETGDVILSLNGKPLRDSGEMKFRLATVPLGESATIDVFREGKTRTYKVKAMAPPDIPPREETLLQGSHPLNGATVANMNPAVAVELGLRSDEEGVVILQAPRGSYSARVVDEGDIALKVNNQDIKTVGDLEQALRKPSRNGWALVLRNQGRTRQILVR